MSHLQRYEEARLHRLEQIRDGDDLFIEATTTPLAPAAGRPGWPARAFYVAGWGRRYCFELRVDLGEGRRLMMYDLAPRRPVKVALVRGALITPVALPADARPIHARHVRPCLEALAAKVGASLETS